MTHLTCARRRRISRRRLFASLVGTLLIEACTTPNIHKTDDFNATTGVQTLAVDAKQRVVVVAKIPDPHPDSGSPGTTTTTTTTTGGDGKTIREEKIVTGGLISVTCAEPSPDALSALSSSVGGSISDPKVAANFAFAQAESAASIGLRTQSIQLLRDGMYRLCEGYAARALDGPEFNRQQRRYQNLMLSLLAIEQLTGAVVPRQAGLGQGSASASVGDKADQAAGNLAKANSDVTAAQSGLTKAKDTQAGDEKTCKADPTSGSCAKAADDKTALDNAQSALDKAKEIQTTDEGVLQAARAAVKANASGAVVNFSDATTTNKISDSTARYIAEATRTIVSTTLLASFAQEECTNVWAFLDKLPAEERTQLLSTNLDSDRPAVAGTTEVTSAQSEFVHLAKNCQSIQNKLISEPAMFTPQYEAIPADPLKVLGALPGISLAADAKPVSFFVVGGAPLYRVNAPPIVLSKEVTWNLKSDNGNFRLQIERPQGASAEGKTAIYVVDSNNAHVEIPLSLEKANASLK